MTLNQKLIEVLDGSKGYASPLGTLATELTLGTTLQGIDTRLTAAEAELGGAGGMTALVLADATGNLSVGGGLPVDPTASTAITGATEVITNFDNTITLPANSLAVGDRVRIRAVGIHTATNAAETLVLTVRAGSTSLGASGSIDPVANDFWLVEYEFVVRAIGSSGELVGAGMATSGTRAGTTVVRHLIATGSGAASHTAVDTTAALVLAIAITHQAAATDGNSSRMDSIAVDVIPAAA